MESFSCQSGYDNFSVPTACLNDDDHQIDARQFINHSCDPNCGYFVENGETFTIAIRDICAGEELTYHYGMLETELSLTYGLECKCGAKNCAGKWQFDLYRRDDVFAVRLMRFAKPELRLQAKALRLEFWHSPDSYLKRASDEQRLTATETPYKLCALRNIRAGHLVGRFINQHRDRYVEFVDPASSLANCIIRDYEIFAKRDLVEGETLFVASRNVYCDGVYDLFHIGHQNHLRNCAKQGDRLLVGICSDSNCASFKRQPIMSETERAFVVSQFDVVCKVISDAPMFIDESFLKLHNIHVVCISPDYAGEDDKYYAVPRRLGMVRVMPRTPNISTSQMIERITKRTKEETKKK